jgi:TPR repeat protein
MYENKQPKPNIPKAFVLSQIAWQLEEDAHAAFLIGMCYLFGMNACHVNEAEGINWLKRALDRDHLGACIVLAFHGRVIRVDHTVMQSVLTSSSSVGRWFWQCADYVTRSNLTSDEVRALMALGFAHPDLIRRDWSMEHASDRFLLAFQQRSMSAMWAVQETLHERWIRMDSICQQACTSASFAPAITSRAHGRVSALWGMSPPTPEEEAWQINCEKVCVKAMLDLK